MSFVDVTAVTAAATSAHAKEFYFTRTQMITAVDTNVLVALWDRDDALNSTAQAALDAAFARGKLVISGAAFAELLALPRRTEAFIEEFLRETGIGVDWITDEAMWQVAGRAFSGLRKSSSQTEVGEPRRLPADFLIGAHAVENGFALLTLDDGIYRAAFPKLRIVKV